MTARRALFSMLFVVGLLVLFPRPSPATTWDYSITAADTPTNIDSAATTAVVDTSNHEIKLPSSFTNSVSFWGSGEADYLVATSNGIKHYAYDGSSMVENAMLNVDTSNPIAMIARDPFPDVLVADSSGLKHYSFSGSDMLENPALSVSGLSGILSVGSAGPNEVDVLLGDGVQHYSFSGGTMVRNLTMEPPAGTNPLGIAAGGGGYDLAIMEQNRVRWFNFTGAGLSENPVLAVTGISNPKAFAVADPNGGYDLAVIEGTGVRHYSFTGSSMVYNSALSVTSGLTAPKAIAIRPGSQDRIIVDGEEVRYYSWNGSSLVYDANKSLTESDIISGEVFYSSGVAQSVAFDPGVDANNVRVRAACEAPDGTTITWSVTADGASWYKRWRVRGAGGSTVLETTSDNGGTWSTVGTASDAYPSASAPLQIAVNPGRIVKWKAELETTDQSVTPKVATTPRGDVAVRLDASSAPLPPILPPGGGACYTTISPELTWTFVDPDAGDSQSAYQVQVVKSVDDSVVWDTDWVTSSDSSVNVPASTEPDAASLLWSSGEYEFKYRVRVKDSAELESDWSNYSAFCVLTFDRFRVAEIVGPPEQTFRAGKPPVIGDPDSHIMITGGMTSTNTPPNGLPLIKAGKKVTVLIDSIGPTDDNEMSAEFPYLSQQSTVDSVTVASTVGLNKRWAISFWTDASQTICPDGTVVQAIISCDGSAGSIDLRAPTYADGVAVTSGSAFAEWYITEQGRKEE